MCQRSRPVSPLCEKRIRKNLAADAHTLLASLVVADVLSSTNDQVLDLLRNARQKYVASVANQQLQGRGRNGRSWQSPAGANIYLSVGCCLPASDAIALNGLSLACGVAVARILSELGVEAVIKWPNDILVADRKLAGILIETRIKKDSMLLVVGLGVNLSMPASVADKIDQPWTDLQQILGSTDARVERNRLVAHLLDGLIMACETFRQSGFASFREDWDRYDLLRGRQVLINGGKDDLQARVLGIAEDYALKIEVDGVEKKLYAGDVSLKLKYHAGH